MVFLEIFLQTYSTRFYNQQIDQKSARNVIIVFFGVVVITTAVIVGLNNYKDFNFEKKIEVEKPKVKREKKRVKKPEIKTKKEVKSLKLNLKKK